MRKRETDRKGAGGFRRQLQAMRGSVDQAWPFTAEHTAAREKARPARGTGRWTGETRGSETTYFAVPRDPSPRRAVASPASPPRRPASLRPSPLLSRSSIAAIPRATLAVRVQRGSFSLPLCPSLRLSPSRPLPPTAHHPPFPFSLPPAPPALPAHRGSLSTRSLSLLSSPSAARRGAARRLSARAPHPSLTPGYLRHPPSGDGPEPLAPLCS